jgi:3-hydroxyacyl-CoA dehydrogenase
MVEHCRESCKQVVSQTTPRPIQSVAIIGAGIMGSAIAIEHAKLSIPVVLIDQDQEALCRAEKTAAQVLRAAERASYVPISARPIRYSSDLNDLAGCDLVIESIAEKQQAKQSLYAAIQRILEPRGIIATNTSTIPIARLAAGLPDSSRFCGLHFCHPVHHRPLVEIIPGPRTTAETLSALVAHSVRIAKLPLLVRDSPGFVVNRLLLAYLNEAMTKLISGVPMETIDAAMVEFGMPLGPISLLDEIGLDTALQSGVVMAEVFGERPTGTELLVRLIKSRQIGLKSGAGFYTYPDKKPNPSVGEIGSPDCLQARSTDGGRFAIARDLLAPMRVQARRMIAEEKVDSISQIDLAMIFGLGFPPWRGGLLWWSNAVGLE